MATVIEGRKPLTYQPLLNKEDIRLLVLDPGPQEAALSGHVLTVSHSDIESGKVKYEAISYSWGDPVKRTNFKCDDGYLSIPTNLYDALWYLRSPDKPRTVWADSICISQNDQEEKAIQVHQRMFAIFNEAAVVILWLGAPKSESQQKHGGLLAVGHLFEMVNAGPGSEEWRKISDSIDRARKRTNVFELDPHLLACKEPDWAAMMSLITVNYFDRLWVLQEAVLARKAIMKFGDEELDWDWARSASKHLLTKFYDIRLIAPAVNQDPLARRHIRAVVLLAAGLGENPLFASHRPGSTNLLSIMLTTDHMRCSDPRDYLFAVIHMIRSSLDASKRLDLNSEHAKLLRPDYKASIYEIFRRLAVFLIINDKQYDYLVFARANLGTLPPSYFELINEDNKDENEKLLIHSTAPSWAPLRLTSLMGTEFYMHSFGHGQGLRQIRPSRAGGDDLSIQQNATISEDGRVLGMLGRIVTTLKAVASRHTQDFLDGEIVTPTNSAASKAFLEDNVLKYIRSNLSELYGRDEWEKIYDEPMMNRLLVFLTAQRSSTNPSIPRSISMRNQPLSSLTELYLQHIKKFAHPDTHPANSGDGLDGSWPTSFDAISKRFLNATSKRKIGKTAEEELGLMPWHAEAGDVVCVFNRVCSPMLLRRREDKTYTVVGECYVERFMQGEALAMDSVPLERVLLA